MAIRNGSDYHQYRVALTSQSPLTEGEKALLAQELATDPEGRGYRNPDNTFKSDEELFYLLNDSYSINNPNPQGLVQKTSVSKAVFGRWLAAPRTAAATHADPAISAKYKALADALMPVIGIMEDILVSSTTLQGLLVQMKADGLITETYEKELTHTPDPSYQATVNLPGRAQTLTQGAVVELGEIAALRQMAEGL